MMFFSLARKIAGCALAFTVLSASAQTVSEPAYANMQRAMGGIIQSATQSMGYNLADPRTYGTLRGFGQVAAGAAASAGTGLLLAGSAPAWASVLATAAVYSAVSYAFPITFDAVVKWAFGSGSTPLTVTKPSTGGSGTISFFPGLQTWVDNHKLPDPFFYVAGLRSASYSPCYYPAAQIGYLWVSNGTGAQGCPFITGNTYVGTTFTNSDCPAGSVQDTWATCVASSTTSVTVSAQTLQDAVSALTAAQKSQPVSSEAMALIVNEMWKKAAAQPGYAGVPYSVTNPVTAAQVQTWQQANPSAYPTVEALTSPVTSGATGFAPSTTTVTSSPVAPATSETSSTATNPSTQTSQINLGPDPNIGLPTLEGTPTAQMILAPLIALFPDLKAYNVPGHSGACPKPSFEVFGKSIVMDQHCTIFEQQRAAMYAAGLLAFTLAALFIVLSA